MGHDWISAFYDIVLPYAFCLIALLVFALILIQIPSQKREEAHQAFLRIGRRTKASLKHGLLRTAAGLLRLFPAPIRRTMSPENKRLNNFIRKNHKWLTNAYFVSAFIAIILIVRQLPGYRRTTLVLLGIVAIIGMRQLIPILQRLSNNAVFSVCPNCGFAHTELVETCKSCGCSQENMADDPPGGVLRNEIPSDLAEEIDRYKHLNAYRELPQAVMRGLRLSEGEIVLISVKIFMTKNGVRKIRNQLNKPCFLNLVVLTNKKISFVSWFLGGWRTIDAYSYDDIKRYFTENRALHTPILHDIDKLTIQAHNNTYILKGYNPHKSFSAIMSCIRERKSLKTEESVL